MKLAWRHSLTSRTLLKIAAAVGVIIVVATCVTYALVFRAAEERGLIHLSQYIAERVQRQEAQLEQIAGNLIVAREAYIRRYREADPPGFLAQWDRWFERNPDGAWRSRREYSNDYEYAPLWAHRDFGPAPSDDLKRRVLVMFEVCQKFLPGWVRGFRSLYGFTSDTPAVIGFDPALPGWVYDQPADYAVNTEEFGAVALRENNPARALAWTGTTSNTGSGTSLVSAVLPVEIDGRHVISVAHDMLVTSLIEETTRSGIPGMTHMIFREDGRIIAYPNRAADIFAGNGQLNMKAAGDPALAALHAAVTGRQGHAFVGYDPVSERYYAVHRLAGPEWLYLAAMPRSVLRDEAFASAKWVLWSAALSLALLLLLLGAILKRSIALPIGELVGVTRRLAAGERDVALPVTRTDELGALVSAFNEMTAQIRARDAALLDEKARLEERVAGRTAELRATNENLRESEERLARALERQTEVARLKSEFVALVSHEFRTPLEVITSSAFNLERYFDRLPPERRQEMLAAIQRAVRRMAGMTEQVLLLGRLEPGRGGFDPRPLELETCCRLVAEETASVTQRRCPVALRLAGDLAGARADEAAFRHLLGNLLSNAVKYSPPGSPVELAVERSGADAVFTVTDRGCGIPEADRARLFEAFRRGANVGHTPGTGLGLVIVRRGVELHGGALTVESREGEGTRFTVRLPLFAPSTASSAVVL